jgi:DNA repair protein RadC
MPPSDRPRERLWELGAKNLGSAELIAILLRTGLKGRSALQLAQDLLRDHHNSLDELSRAPVELLAKHKGIGRTKASHLKAAFELARRLKDSDGTHAAVIDTPAVAAAELREEVRAENREVFFLLLLNTKNGLIRKAEVSSGSLNASIVEPREVFLEAIKASAASVILAHNHPSGDPTPSSEDIAITKRLVKAGELLNIPVLDHIILGRRTNERPQDYTSLKELGLM